MNCPEINGFITGGIYMFYEKKHGECESFVGQNLKNFDKNKNTYCPTSQES
jgi:hypothetical protein